MLSSSTKKPLTQRASYPRVLQPLQHLEEILRGLLRLIIPFHVRQWELDADGLAIGGSPVILHVAPCEKNPDQEGGRDAEVEPNWEGRGRYEGEDGGCEERCEDLLWIQSLGNLGLCSSTCCDHLASFLVVCSYFCRLVMARPSLWHNTQGTFDTAAGAAVILDLDKENRPPRGMATNKGNMTPSRQRRKAQDTQHQQQYFDVGKVGRYARVIGQDSNAHAMLTFYAQENGHHSPRQRPRNDATMSSSEMHVQDSSAPEVEQTLHMRKTPKLPPPRASTPRHTHIGSPKRMSASRPHTTGKPLPVEDAEEGASPTQAKTQPPANRKLDFTGEGAVRKSIESLSPFKPRKTLRRSMGPQQSRSGVFDSPAKSEKRKSTVTEREDSTVHQSDDGEALEPTVVDETTVNQTEQQTEQQTEVEEDEQQTELPQAEDDGPLILDGDDGYQTTYDDQVPDEEAGAEEEQSSPSGRRANRPRKSIESVKDTIVEPSPSTAKATPSSRKRNRASMESQHAETVADGTTVQEDQTSIHQEPSVVASPPQKKPRGRPRKDKVVVHHEDGDEAIDPQLLAHGDQYTADEHLQQRLKDIKKSKPGAPRERDPNRSMRAATSPVRNQRASIDPSQRQPPSHDAFRRRRKQRHSFRPTRVQTAPILGQRNAGMATRPSRGHHDIEEESETESTFADEWEDSVGVIAGSVAAYDPVTGTGSNSLPAVREDLAFASSSIVTRDVAGSEFNSRPRGSSGRRIRGRCRWWGVGCAERWAYFGAQPCRSGDFPDERYFLDLGGCLSWFKDFLALDAATSGCSGYGKERSISRGTNQVQLDAPFSIQDIPSRDQDIASIVWIASGATPTKLSGVNLHEHRMNGFPSWICHMLCNGTVVVLARKKLLFWTLSGRRAPGLDLTLCSLPRSPFPPMTWM
ncbi:hypothetical protein KC367_g57 [Hortaea werneckii]|nr:hypothetical protein KC367_g57 [Hortaea werneckii]